jgi:hypothetical protein
MRYRADLLDPSNPVYVTGSEADREAARREWRRERFAAQVAASQLEELDRADVSVRRFSIVEHVPSGRLQAAHR